MALEFLQAVRRKGHKVSVLIGSLGSGTDCDIETEFSRSGIDFHFVRKLDMLSHVIGTPYPIFRNVSTYLAFIDPDLVHVNSHLFLNSYQVVRASRSMHIPTVLTVHGVMAERDLILRALQGIYLRTVAKSTFNKVSTIVCLTKSDAKRIATLLGSYDRISVVPNGVDTMFFRPSINKDPDLIVWVGRLVPEKGLMYLFKAMQSVAKEKRNAKLMVIGDGPLKTRLISWVRKMGLYGRILFLGSLDRAKVAEILSKSSIFAFPSLREGMPLSVLEAMACGLPVVGFNIPGLKDVVEDGRTGLLVPTRNSELLSNAILSLLKNEALRENLSENARRTAVERYSLKMMVTRLDRLYCNTCISRVQIQK